MTERNFDENPVPTPLGDAKPTSTNAILSLILSILGVIGIVPVIGSILGLVFGYTARNELKESADELGGEGMAQWGIILGWVGLALVLLACCIAAFAFFFFFVIAISESSGGYYGYLPSMLGMLV